MTYKPKFLTPAEGGLGHSTTATSGTILRGDGTNWTQTTAQYPNTAGTSGNLLQSDGSNFVSTAPVMLTVSGTLTNAQIKALHATPIQIIAAPGVGNVILVQRLVAKLNYGGTNVFTAAASQTIDAYYGTAISIGTTLNNAGIVAAASQLQSNGANVSAAAYASLSNVAVNLYNSVVTEIAGNAANNNTISYWVAYSIVTI